MKPKILILAIPLGAVVSLSVLAGSSIVFATNTSYNCNLGAGSHCGSSYTALSFQSNVNSNSAGTKICAGYVYNSTIHCISITTGQGSGFDGTYGTISFSSYYKNTGSTSTTIGVTDFTCNCESPV